MITEAGEGAESAFDSAEQCGDLFPVPAHDVVGDVVSGEQDNIGFEEVDTFDAAAEVLCADGAAEVDIAYVSDSRSVQSVMPFGEVEVYLDDFEPLGSGSVYVHSRAGTEAEGSKGKAL